MKALLLALALTTTMAFGQAPIRVATEGNYPPFNYVENGEIKGFDIDLMREVCRRSNLVCEFVFPVTFSELLPGLEAGHYDATIAGMGITESREKNFSFAGPYYKASKYFFGKKNLPLTDIPEGLVGRKVGVQEGTVRVDYMNHLAKALKERGSGGEFTLLVFPSDTELDQALLTGSIDLVIKDSGALDKAMDRPEFSNYGKLGPELSLGEGGHLFGKGDGIGLRKGDAREFLFNSALQSMFYDCAYAEIEGRYFKTANALVPEHCRNFARLEVSSAKAIPPHFPPKKDRQNIRRKR